MSGWGSLLVECTAAFTHDDVMDDLERGVTPIDLEKDRLRHWHFRRLIWITPFDSVSADSPQQAPPKSDA